MAIINKEEHSYRPHTLLVTLAPYATFSCASPGMRRCVSRKEPARRSHHVKYSACGAMRRRVHGCNVR